MTAIAFLKRTARRHRTARVVAVVVARCAVVLPHVPDASPDAAHAPRRG